MYRAFIVIVLKARPWKCYCKPPAYGLGIALLEHSQLVRIANFWKIAAPNKCQKNGISLSTWCKHGPRCHISNIRYYFPHTPSGFTPDKAAQSGTIYSRTMIEVIGLLQGKFAHTKCHMWNGIWIIWYRKLNACSESNKSDSSAFIFMNLHFEHSHQLISSALFLFLSSRRAAAKTNIGLGVESIFCQTRAINSLWSDQHVRQNDRLSHMTAKTLFIVKTDFVPARDNSALSLRYWSIIFVA